MPDTAPARTGSSCHGAHDCHEPPWQWPPVPGHISAQKKHSGPDSAVAVSGPECLLVSEFRRSKAQYNAAQRSATQHNAAQRSATQHNAAHDCAVPPRRHLQPAAMRLSSWEACQSGSRASGWRACAVAWQQSSIPYKEDSERCLSLLYVCSCGTSGSIFRPAGPKSQLQCPTASVHGSCGS